MNAEPQDVIRERLQRALGTAYTLERELGGGGMSRVFVAEESALRRRVVVKVLSPDVAHELSADRFAREVELSARLQHPNIVPVLAAGVADGMPYYTMPFINGESLRARMDRSDDGIPPAQGVDILRDVARALAYAHDQGVVHRDIKPENVLLALGAAIVADFGVAKAMAAARTGDSSAATLTRSGIAPGTPAYMSPEQASGDPAVDHRADLYAWGIVAYEVLSGAHPFAGHHSVHALVSAHLVETPRPLQEAAPGVNPDLASLVMRCMAKNPAERPESAREVVSSLANVDRPNDTRQPGNPRRQLRPVAMIGAGALVAVFAILAGTIWFADGAGDRLARTSAVTVPGTPARDAYLRGRVRVSSENRQDNEAAIAALAEAIQLDPNLAPAHAALARAYTIKAFYFAPDSEKKQLNEDAEVAVEKALSIDPQLADGHFARGLLLWTPTRRFPHEQAVSSYQKALALDPKLDEAHHQLALVYMHVGLLDEADAELEKALAINPGNTLARFRVGVVDLYRGDYESALRIFNSTPLERNPPLWAFQAATALFRLGREREATEIIDQFLGKYPQDEGGVGHSVRALMLAAAGRRSETQKAIAKALELGRGFGHFHHAAYNIASAYALLGNKDQAIQWLEHAADDGFPCYPLFAKDKQLDRIRADTRFVSLMARLERDWKERQKTF